MSASKHLQYYFEDKTFSIPNGVKAPLGMPHKFLWVTAICHAHVILTLHSKSPWCKPTSTPNKSSWLFILQNIPGFLYYRIRHQLHTGLRQTQVRWFTCGYPAEQWPRQQEKPQVPSSEPSTISSPEPLKGGRCKSFGDDLQISHS